MKVIEKFWDKIEVLREQRDFNWELFENESQPHITSKYFENIFSTLWTLTTSIFDVHVFRFPSISSSMVL